MANQITQNSNLPLTDTDFKAYRGVDNPIDFVIRNGDRQPVDLTGLEVIITVFSFFDGSLLLQKNADITDALCGKVRVILTKGETANWTNGFHRYSLTVVTADGSCQPLFMDLDHNAAGFFELLGGIIPATIESFKILGEDFTPTNLSPPTVDPTVFISSAFPGDASKCENDGLHTVALSADDYTGKFFVQGSLEEQATPNDGDWFDIWLSSTKPELKLIDFTGLDPFNFTASVRWVRFLHIPDSANTGKIIKVLYRN